MVILSVIVGGIFLQTQQTGFTDQIADGYVPYGTGATDLKAYYDISTNEYGADIEVGVGEFSIDAFKVPQFSTTQDCSNNRNNLGQQGFVKLLKATNANLKFTIEQNDRGNCYTRHGSNPVGDAWIQFGSDCIAREPGDYRVDVELNGNNAYLSKGNTRICTFPKNTVPVANAGYAGFTITNLRMRKPFSCVQAENELLGGRAFKAGETVSALSFSYFVRVCPIHLPIVVDADMGGSDVDFTLYQKLAEGKTVTVPTGQVWVVQYVFDAKEAGIEDLACPEFYNPDIEDCDAVAGYVNFLDRGGSRY